MRTLITIGAVVGSLAFAGTSAMAATTNVHKNTSTHAVHARPAVHRVVHAPAVHHTVHARAAVRVATPRRYARSPYGFDVGQFIQSMLGGAWPPVNVRLAHSAGRTHGYSSGSSNYSPSYESPPISTSSPADDAAAQAQQMNDTNAMLQSMQAAQQQNDEANAEVNAGLAAALQTEINANN
jgi:hypothetical protein